MMDQKLESSLKISNIQSLKQENDKTQDSTIKIRTISEINQSHEEANQVKNIVITKQHPSQQILSKHIVVKKVQNSSFGSNKSPVFSRSATNGTQRINKSPASSQQQIPESPAKPHINFTIPPVLDAYIKELEEQNKDMKKVLMECRREVVSIQMRTHKLTNLINATIGKCNIKRPMAAMKQAMTISQTQHIPTSNTQQAPVLQKTFKILPKKSNNITAKGNIVCRVPVFPITRLSILKQLELDLSKKEFSEYVFQKLYSTNNKSNNIDKPSVLLNNTLNSMIDPKLMGLFQYEEMSETKDSSECEYFKSLQRVRVLYGKLVNALSNTIFTKSVDMVALEKFVKTKISNHRNEHLANLERLKSLKSEESTALTIKMEKVDSNEQCVKVNENQLRWLENDQDEQMHIDDDL